MRTTPATRGRSIQWNNCANVTDAEPPQACRQFLLPQTDPGHVRNFLIGSQALGFGQHSLVWVEVDYRLEQVREAPRDRARPAPDIEQPAPAVEPDRVLEHIGERRRVRQAAALVVRRGTGEERLIPGPVLPTHAAHASAVNASITDRLLAQRDERNSRRQPNGARAKRQQPTAGDLGQLRAVDLCGRAAVQIERLANPVCVKGLVGGASKQARGRWS